MREILFRGKDAVDGSWRTGYLVDEKHIGDFLLCYPIRPETVGQYTGLTDKNGKKIFEGDLLLNDCDTYLVSWDCGNLEYILDDGKVSFSMACISPSRVEVIGNIHDNPELLGGADNGE